MSDSAAEALPRDVRELLERLVKERHYPDLDAALADVVRRESELVDARSKGWHVIAVKGEQMHELV